MHEQQSWGEHGLGEDHFVPSTCKYTQSQIDSLHMLLQPSVMFSILCDDSWLKTRISSPSLLLLHQHVSQVIRGIKNMRDLWSF